MTKLLMVLGALACAHAARADVTIASPSPTGANLNGVFGLGKTVFAVGDVGTIVKTSDAGKTWTRVPLASRLVLHAIWGTGKDLYVTADNATIFVSNDGGATFVEHHPPGHATAYEAVWGAAPDDVIAVGVNGDIAQTKDHGKTWTQMNVDGKLSYSTYYAVVGASAKDVFAVGEGGVLAQRDTGLWLGGGQRGIGMRGMAATSTGYVAVGEQGAIVRYDPKGGSSDVKPVTDRILRAVWADGAMVVAVGETSGAGGTVLRSTDAGKTWTKIDGKVDHHISAIWGVSSALWIVGEGGVIGRSTDGGATWTALGARTLPDASVTTFATDGKAIVAAGGDALARSVDRGKTWTAIAGVPGQDVVATTGGFVAISGTEVRRSTDGGATWKMLGTVASLSLTHAAASGAAIVVTGYSGKVWSSADGGATWHASSGAFEAKALWASGTSFYVAGDDGALARSTDGGATWKPIAGIGKGRALDGGYADGTTIVVVGSHGESGRGDHGPSRGLVVVSHDGGATWTETEIPAHYQLAALAGSKSLLVAAGDHGAFEISRDHGKTWKPTSYPTENHASAVWTDGTTILVGSDRGELWHATP